MFQRVSYVIKKIVSHVSSFDELKIVFPKSLTSRTSYKIYKDKETSNYFNPFYFL